MLDEKLTERLSGMVVQSVETYLYGPATITFTDGTVVVFNASGQPPTVLPSLMKPHPPPLMARVVFS